MRVLGIESTAHTFGAGVVIDGKVASNVRKMYIPERGGIHPREAADHHVENGPAVIEGALAQAGTSKEDLDLICFSKGPGLGPCLRVGATIARVISVRTGAPLLGVNHCVAHLEIGSLMGTDDPVLLYVSGGNTQIIAYVKGRYRVLGETLDVGIGNMLDKMGREMGIPFPAGPAIERLARGEKVAGLWENGDGAAPELLDLPYSVKGMDVSFSGIMTAALGQYERGADLPSICHSVQETCFSMLCEVAERAMAHIGGTELLLGGGVACNERLKGMASTMARERGGRSFAPPKELAVDNGAMIAFLGDVMFQAGSRQALEDTVIDQRFRTDQVEVTWKGEKVLGKIHTPGTDDAVHDAMPLPGAVLGRGAEAVITFERFQGLPAVRKHRIPKGYRVPRLERKLTSSRIRKEVKMLQAIREAGVRTPHVLDVDENGSVIRLEFLHGPRLASILNVISPEAQKAAFREMGRMAGRVHGNGMVHGDLTTSNFILLSGPDAPVELGLIDCSMAERTDEIEKMGVDLRLFFEVLSSTHTTLERFEPDFWEGYSGEFNDWELAKAKLDDIGARGRYMSQRWTA